MGPKQVLPSGRSVVNTRVLLATHVLSKESTRIAVLQYITLFVNLVQTNISHRLAGEAIMEKDLSYPSDPFYG